MTETRDYQAGSVMNELGSRDRALIFLDPTHCVCGHPVDDHDGIAVRYCAATTDGALHRGCICLAALGPSSAPI